GRRPASRRNAPVTGRAVPGARVASGARDLPGTRGAPATRDAAGSRDLVITNATIVDVVTHSTFRGWISIVDGRFREVEVGAPGPDVESSAAATLDLEGAFVQPGMLDIHMHIESSLVTPRRFAEAALPHGTTTILQDPHEVANVLGAPGVRWMLEASRGLPQRVYTAVSSCVPATSAEIETPNASISPAEVTELAREPEVIALGEMMDFHGLIDGDAHHAAMLRAGAAAGLTLEGHVPSLTGPDLSRYIAYGIRSDHTLMTPTKLLEQLRKGMWVMVQEKSVTPEVVATIMGLPDRSRVMLITDDVMPNRLVRGHLDRIVRRAIETGWDAFDALAAATVRPATYLGLHGLGTITPGAHADFVVTPTLATYPPSRVYVAGQLVAQDGTTIVASVPSPRPRAVPGLVETFAAGAFDASAFRFVAPLRGATVLGAGRVSVRARVIEANDENSFTTLSERDVEIADGVPLDPDLVLATVIPRAAARPGAAAYSPVMVLIDGLGLKSGSYATTFAHDSHNIFVIGRSTASMAAALTAVLEAGGGMAFASDDGQSIRPILLRLPLAALLSDEPIASVAADFDAIETALRCAGMTARNPVLLLTLLPLSVSPDFKVSDKGIIDVQGRRVLTPVAA
ncbi:MAG TPA: adenine deaminase C-terminal domain-containing protein, partial [Trueperaceae bacterium]|nr:adenine deaminase C-terminal domain-containing protein [Trueperaceae bacterium]